MGGDVAVAGVKGDVVEVGDVSVAFPIPADDIARFHFVERLDFFCIATADEDGVDDARSTGLTVSGRGPAGNVEAATPLMGFAADAAGNEMSAVIADDVAGDRCARAVVKVSPVGGHVAIGPKISIATHISGVVVGVGDGFGSVVLVG